MKFDYSIHIAWSKEDESYLAVIPELPGCISDGETPERAMANARVVAAELIETAKDLGRRIPKPMSVEDSQRESVELNQKLSHGLQEYIRNALAQAGAQFVQGSVALSSSVRLDPDERIGAPVHRKKPEHQAA